MVNLIARNWCIFRKLGGGKKRIQIKDYAKEMKKKRKEKEMEKKKAVVQLWCIDSDLAHSDMARYDWSGIWVQVTR